MKKNKEKTAGKREQWNVRDIDRETINAAKICAKKLDKTVGQWLNEIVLKAAQEMLTKKTEVIKPEDVRDVLKDFVKQFEERHDRLEERLQMLSEPWHKRVFRRK